MSIGKSILLTLLLYLLAAAFGFFFAYLFPINKYLGYVNLIDLAPYIIAHSILLFYFLNYKPELPLLNEQKSSALKIILPFLLIISIGDHLIDLPFFQWKSLSNEYFGTKWEIPDYSDYRFSYQQCYRGFSAVFLAPFFEELIFRYYIFGGLLSRYRFSAAALISSTLFAIIHFSGLTSLRNILPAFFFGVISCNIYYRTRNIRFSMILHSICNFYWFLTVIFAKEYMLIFKRMGHGVLYWTIILVGISILILAIRKLPGKSYAEMCEPEIS